ncbi:uncharacterized protein ARMOST_05854 [Armillaria ostoyae]|uniref:Uncharacterized protein n=1 Tax=Armillaria ostoyae TaxID=47428 RepID=A0A284R1C6_ARMOS|nr:uncharacterized protein ARMOST_05854 [Armillaria ostoyae]
MTVRGTGHGCQQQQVTAEQVKKKTARMVQNAEDRRIQAILMCHRDKHEEAGFKRLLQGYKNQKEHWVRLASEHGAMEDIHKRLEAISDSS